MKKVDRSEYINYKLEEAHKTWDAARLLAENEFWNSAVNRLYYSAFYAVSALLTQNDINSKTHSSSRNMFSLHFVKTGIFDKKYAKLLAKLFAWRQKSDYDNFVDYDKESVEPLFALVKEMVNEIESYLKE